MPSARVLVPVALAAAIVLAGGLVVRTGRPSAASADGAGAAPAAIDPSVRRDATVRAVEAVSPAVVNISTERVVEARDPFFGFRDDIFEDFFRQHAPRRRIRQTSLGSGVIVDASGYVVTNAHVVARATAIQVSLALEVAGVRDFAASLVNIAPEVDLALLRIDGLADGPVFRPSARPRFPVARLGRGDDMVGETVIAVGNPFGLGSTVTRGVLSAKDRVMDDGPARGEFLQTDAAINPGNSGGALVNLAGEVIGINTAIHAQAHGIGFAIPATRARATLLALLDERELAGLWSGLALDPADAAEGGAAVLEVAPGSPAAEAGLAPGDRIVEAGGEPVRWAFAVKKRLLEAGAGVSVPLLVERGGSRREVRLALAPAPQTPGQKLARERLGVLAKPVTNLLAERAGMDEAAGILVARVEEDGPAHRAGLRPGDVIVRMGVPIVGRRDILRWEVYDLRTVDDLAAPLSRVDPGGRALVFVLREGRELRGEVTPR